ncbi:MAG: RNA polymerase sigma factor [Firmicutes bacterium]|nr:RNA polymerase sigma factor [Bacillota bacterium]
MSPFAAKTEYKREEASTDLDALLKDISEGSQDALAQLYRYTRSSVYSFALSILKNTHDAEDVLHDCYVSVWHGAAGYRSQGKPLAWMMTITRNLCLQRIRERRKTADIPQEEWTLHLPDDGRLTMEEKCVLSACLEKLSAQERQIVTLFAVSGFKHREIATLLELPLSTVLSKYHRAIKRLKQHLQ